MTENEILTSCKNRLDNWKSQGVVLNYERINCGKVLTEHRTWFTGAKKGFPDLFVEVIKDDMIYLCYFETKRPGGGRRQEQLEFLEKRRNFKNVICEFIEHPSQVDRAIESIVGDPLDKLPKEIG